MANTALKTILAGVSLVVPCAGTEAATNLSPIEVSVDLSKKGPECPRTLYGIFFEDINRSADGGLYPELLVNRGFDWQTKELEGWERDARGDGMARITRQYGRPLHEATAAHLRIEVFGAGLGVGVRNRGHQGIHVEKGKKYTLSFHARALDGYRGGLRAVLETRDGRSLCSFAVANGELNVGEPRTGAMFPLPDWKRYVTTLTAPETADVTFSILLDAAGVVELELVSLFPQDTWGGRPNGLRKDLVQLLKDLKPGIMRFPGGCLTEGDDWPRWYDWKLSVGDGTLESRSCIWNVWGYWQTLGLGFYEYFLLCEDIGAEPLPVMNGGLTCQFRKPWDLAPMESMEYFAGNFCDLIEFANGDAKTTVWGRVRAKMGHPAPFNMKYLGIGNENWGREFLDRYNAIAEIVRRRHPEIILVSSAGAGPAGSNFTLSWNTLNTRLADLADEHYYEGPAWMLDNDRRYDGYPRRADRPKVYVGEYGCRVRGHRNTLYAALCEAALMTGFERNCDVVRMTSYAPLFHKIGASTWLRDLIWFDNATCFGTPSYYVQKMYSLNRPTYVVPSTARTLTPPVQKGGVALQTWKTAAEFKDVRVTAPDGTTLWAGLPDPVRCSRESGGRWERRNGVLRQANAERTNTELRFGDAKWGDLTFSFKARRIGGTEGFMPQVLVAGSRKLRVNLGGWENAESAFETFGCLVDNVTHVPQSFETNRWYDVSIDVRGDRVTAAVDGRTVLRTTVVSFDENRFYQVCGIDEATDELVIKLVNVSRSPRPAVLKFGRALPAGCTKVQTLSGDFNVENSIAWPTKCATRFAEVDFPGGTTWTYSLPASSFTVIRIRR